MRFESIHYSILMYVTKGKGEYHADIN